MNAPEFYGIHPKPGVRLFWTVLSEADPSPNRQRRVLCRCACGRESVVALSNIRLGRSLSCGCGGKHLPGERFGRLVIQSRDGSNAVCLCDCGRTVTVWVNNLITGNTRSCGCGQSRAGSKAPRRKQSVAVIASSLGISRQRYYGLLRLETEKLERKENA